MIFNPSLNEGPREGNKEAIDQPKVDHLGVRRWWELLYLAREDGRHHQHDGQVDRDAGLEVERLEVAGGVGHEQEKQGWKIRCQQLFQDLSLQHNHHLNLLTSIGEADVGDGEHDQVLVLRDQVLELVGNVVRVKHQHLITRIQCAIKAFS